MSDKLRNFTTEFYGVMHGVTRSFCARLQIDVQTSIIPLDNKIFIYKDKEIKKNTMYQCGILKPLPKLRETPSCPQDSSPPWLNILGALL